MTFRCAIWAAVSTDAQAANDKVSLDEQEAQCRALITARAWVETAGPYIVPGESRTRWVNLRDAETAIPQLHAMLDAAQAGRYDLLIMYDYNRLRDLLDPVAKTLSHYGAQIYSLSQPVEPQPPAQYTPYASDASSMMQGLSRIISQAQNADLRRKYRFAMPRRASERGLPHRIPWGYIKPPGRETDRNAVPVQIIEQAVLIRRAAEMYVAGRPLAEVCQMLNESGQPPSHGGMTWYPNVVREMLANPFYAGIIVWGQTRSQLDPRTGQVKQVKTTAQPIIGQGRHIPLWDEAMHRSILAEIARRGHKYSGKKVHPLTGLLRCGICGKTLYTYYNGRFGVDDPARVWRCSSRLGHVVISHAEAHNRLAARLVADIRAENPSVPQPAAPPPEENHAARLLSLQSRRKRLEDGYLAGVITLQTFAAEGLRIDGEIGRVETLLAAQTGHDQASLERQAALRHLSGLLDRLPAYLRSADPVEVNRLLKMLIEKIVVGQDHELAVEYR